MATDSFALVLGRVPCSCRGLTGAEIVRLSIAGGRPSIGVSCKARNRNLSSQHRRHQNKKVSPKRSPLNMNIQAREVENKDVQNVKKDKNIDAPLDTLSTSVANTSSDTKADVTQTSTREKVIQPYNDEGEEAQKVMKDNMTDAPFDTLSSSMTDDKSSPTKADETLSSAGEQIILTDNTDGGGAGGHDERGGHGGRDGAHPFRNVRVEDLINLIKSAEKNILLLNQARVRALEDLEKSLSEKEALQAQINGLEKKLAETDARIKLAATEKVKVELLEDQLEKLKIEMSSMNSIDGGNIGEYENTKFLPLDINALPLGEELRCLQKENMLLMEDIQILKAKLSDMEQTEERVLILEKEKSLLEATIKDLEFRLSLAQEDVSKLAIVKSECRSLQEKVEQRLQMSDQEILSKVHSFQESVKEFQNSLNKLEGGKRNALVEPAEDMPWEFWSRLLLTIDCWLLEKKISPSDAKLLREMAWKRDGQIRDTYLTCKGKNEQDAVEMFLKLILSPTRPGLNIVHIAAEMAPVAKVGGLGDVVSGLGKALQRKGHLVEIILPKYDCMQYEHVTDLKALDVNIESFFDGQLHKNKIWIGTVEGLPVYFIEPHHSAKFFWRGQFYGEHDDFKRFSFFSRAALEFLNQAEKRPDIIHCHDWQTAFVAPLYWDVYKYLGFNSARICFTCHNFEYQGTTAASELSSCGLDVSRLKRPDRMEDNSAHDKINPVKGAVVYSNIVTTVSPTYAQEVLTAEGSRGLHETLKYHSKKFVGILNGIDTDVWNPSTDAFLRFQYSADDLQGKAENKDALRRQLKLSSSEPFQPLVGCITRLVPQKGVHLIRHAIYRTLGLGGQFVLLGSSPVPNIQNEFRDIAKHFQSHPHIRLVLKYDEALSHSIYAASDMFIVPSIFEPCGLTQMIAMRYGSIPIVRRTGGLNDSVFDVDDDSVPLEYRNGFTFSAPNEQELDDAMERAFNYYMKRHEIWQELVQKDMRIDFSWESSAAQYEELYENAVARARAVSTSP